ncbi:histidine phosphatase family protein [Ureibacillus manganicus]|uniref:Phosphoglycerate mutase n=1 Tax=Ureibacillus manganicus DSM 26584 TaxID=1384049 RepID=A0A0A3I4W5_9BACL|nr:histidine phosphatase family protein [Ureibacillus manganicus]KGR79821.1 phosphoglycerate mutase [Ureibacillus manganicus DSM 26584]
MNSVLLNSLRNGGFILYVRHGEANVGNDLPNLNFQNCLTQRNLSNMGRSQARYYGEILRYLQIPIQIPIIASSYCRTIETAQLAFGIENVQDNPILVGVNRLNGNLPSNDRQKILKQLTSVLEEIPEDGKNKVIVAHSFPNGVGIGSIPYTGTVIVKPKGKGNGYEVVGKLSLADWSRLVN